MAKFDKIESLYEKCHHCFDDAFERAGMPFTADDWLNLGPQRFLRLVYECVQVSKYHEYIDLLCDYWLDQYERGGLLALWEISNALIDRKDTQKLLKLWRAALRQRRECKKDFLEFFHHYECVLVKAKLYDEIPKARKEYQEILAPKLDQVIGVRVMSSKLFWDLIEKAKDRSENNAERSYELGKLLLPFLPSEVARFSKYFYQQMSKSYTWDLWAAAYIAFGGCSDDGFEYFRAWLISEGREHFESVLSDVNNIAKLKLVPDQLEAILSTANNIYKEKTGKRFDVEYNLAGTPTGKEWKESEKELKKRYPMLWSYFNKST
jgi:hypothetical protein